MKVKKTIIYKGVAIQINVCHYNTLGEIFYVTLSNSDKRIRFDNIPINQVINEVIRFLDTGKTNLDTEYINTIKDTQNGSTKPCTIYW
jgi:hypothetical protein